MSRNDRDLIEKAPGVTKDLHRESEIETCADETDRSIRTLQSKMLEFAYNQIRL